MKRIWQIMCVLGQWAAEPYGISAGSTSAALAGLGASNPFFQSCITYFLLWASGVETVHKAGWRQAKWKYLVLAILDVSSTFCLVKAYKFTSITSATLLDSWTVPCVMLLTTVLFQQRCVHLSA
jgi:solute carrier family 35, member F1/2